MRLLLDAHVPLAVAVQLRQRGVDAVALRDWRSGAYLTASDEHILLGAVEQNRVFVTYDVHSIPPLLRNLAERGQPHSGVVFIDGRTIRPNDVGALTTGLVALVADAGSADWTNVARFLPAPRFGA